jgi:hypothetical protein
LLATGCGRPSAETTLVAGSGVTLDQVSQSSPSAHRMSRDWTGLYGRWCAQVALPPGVNGIARCEVTPILNDHFLSCILTLTSEQREGGMCLSFVVLQDASNATFKCWGLVSTGEHMTATLSKPNQRSWTWGFTSVRADGVTGTATHTWAIVDDNTWTWEVKDRKWDNGTRSPGLFLTLKRHPASGAESKVAPHDGKSADSDVCPTRKENRTMNRHILRVVDQYGLEVLKLSGESFEEVKP